MQPRPIASPFTSRPQFLLGAFTLIELLTVIAIIGILAAILIPTVGRVRESSKNAVCKSNLRQIGVAVSLYITENKTYPSGVSQLYVSELAPYMNPNATTWQDISKGTPNDECPSRGITVSGSINISYSTNPFVFVNGNTTPRLAPGKVTRPTETILLADAIQMTDGRTNSRLLAYDGLRNATDATAENLLAVGSDADGLNTNADASFRYRHNGRINAVMGDISVRDFAKGTIKQRNLVINY